MDTYAFQFCPKLVVLSQDLSRVLLCKREGEADYDETFSFIGGKMEVTDASINEGIKREKDEEVGEACKLWLHTAFNSSVLFRKKDGSAMIIPHYLAIHEEGEINLNLDEYSEYLWVNVDELDAFEPKIENIPEMVKKLLRLQALSDKDDVLLI